MTWQLILYRAVIAPFGLFAGIVLSLFSEKIRQTMALRRKPIEWPEWIGQAETIWIHCSSGEFEYARPVIRELKILRPKAKVFVTYFSSSYEKRVQSATEVDASAPLPLDLPNPMRAFIRKLKPSLLAVSRTDLWPEMCYQTRSLKIPITLFSRTQRSLSSVPRWKHPFLRWFYSQVDQTLVVSQSDASELNVLKVKNVFVMGDSRYDQVLYRLANAKPVRSELLKSPGAPIVVAGSTWPEDERELFDGLAIVLKENLIRLILVPHEVNPSHLKDLKVQLRARSLSFQTYSEANFWNAPVLIVDQIGILAELYQFGQLAFVGGSFKSTVHSVMEPLAAGLITLVGPKFSNNREAIEFNEIKVSADISAVHAVSSGNDLSSLVMKAISLNPGSSQKILAEIRVRQGASRRIAEKLLDKLVSV